ncbi:MAG: HDIG domain-containing protein [Candidatus Lernaella stagnicola]|nr:HDIG domain-containing protein [Candidatus Lernaella stagnicola]
MSEKKGARRRLGGLPRTSARDFFERFHWRRWLMLAGFAMLVALALSPNLLSRVPGYEIGEYNVGNYRAPFPISFIDDEATLEARREAMDKVPPVFEYNPEEFKRIGARLRKAFEDMHSLYALLNALESERLSKREKAEKLIAAQQELKKTLVAERVPFGTQLGTELTDREFENLVERQFAPKLIEPVIEMLRFVYSDYVTFDLEEVRGALQSDGDNEVPGRVAVRVRGDAELRYPQDLAAFVSPRQAESSLQDLFEEHVKNIPAELRSLSLRIAVAQVKPNLIYDAAATATAKQRAANIIVPVTIAFEKNESIIGDGVKVSRQIALVFLHIRQKTAAADWAFSFLGMSLLVFVTLLLSFWLTDINISRFVISDRDAMMMGVLLVFGLFGLRFASWFDERLVNLFPNMPSGLMVFLFPIAAPAMLVRFLTRFETAMIFTVVLTFLSVLAFNPNPQMLPMLFLIMFVGIHSMRDVTRRSHVLKGGLLVGLTFIGMAIIDAFLQRDYSVDALLVAPGVGMLSGMLAGVLVLGLAPVFEYAFGYMTNISLLELANYEHPLLKRLARFSPGTFHHSIAISSLAEAAAEAIGANRLLVRIGAMYHDVGKTANARYFVENQRGENPHDEIRDPIESARIVISHVPDGVTLARQSGLPQDIIDFIEQHHGTRSVTYFLAKAKEEADENGGEVDESLFAYPGPKPQTKETAILMMCDVVEARSRTLKDRTPENVSAMIREMIDRIRADGQLDECPLTEPDLHRIVEAVTGVVIGMQHDRIAYPDQMRKSLLRGLFNKNYWSS